MKHLTISLALLFGLAAPSFAQSPETAEGTFLNGKGERIGTATLEQTPNGVLIAVDIEGLPAGEHGFHIHETGRCEPSTGFESAGGHYAPRGHQHGFQDAEGPHAGDMPNQFVQDDGVLRAEVVNRNVTLRSDTGTLFDEDGSALVVHAKSDDYTSQPSGKAGDRLACAVIEQS
ncbi:superoxide dismutase family protein [Rhodoligotrophos defluvii]|uniref:superoxide dismutase family protein n=1 Tax=Rhodoligotrophos defluvii TaxID=2561934 RepID=UPI0010C942FC|nr:superoxide dismutase family protein [Rhodoligotrophos defluvii]